MRIWHAFLLTVALTGLGHAANDSRAETAVRRAQELAAAQPQEPRFHLQLGQAWLRRAIETGHPDHYDQAEAAVAAALSLSPENLPIRKLQIEILLGKGLYREALEQTLPLHRKVLDDLDLYGYLADVYMALGEYEKAEEAAQWMLDLRPTDVAGLLRAARLREVFGDLDGAIDFLNRTALGLGPNQPEKQILTLSEISRILLIQGRVDQAEAVLDQALRMSSSHQAALRQLAAIRERQVRWPEALEALHRRCDNGPSPQHLYDLASALSRAGRSDEASKLFSQFESEALKRGNARSELVLYYADFAARPAQALRLAQEMTQWRRDIEARRTLARALYANSRLEEAMEQIEAVLQFGSRDPETLRLAAEIKGAKASESGS